LIMDRKEAFELVIREDERSRKWAGLTTVGAFSTEGCIFLFFCYLFLWYGRDTQVASVLCRLEANRLSAASRAHTLESQTKQVVLLPNVTLLDITVSSW
jgi:hypothetical protein